MQVLVDNKETEPQKANDVYLNQNQHLHQLYLHKNIQFQKELKNYISLIILSLNNCNVTSFLQIPYFKDLIVLQLDNNLIGSFLYLNIYRKLKKLSIKNNPILSNIKQSKIISFLRGAFPELVYFNDVQLQYNLMQSTDKINYNLSIQLLTHNFTQMQENTMLFQSDALNESEYKHYIFLDNKIYDNLKYVPLEQFNKNIILQISRKKREYCLISIVPHLRHGQIFVNIVQEPTYFGDLLNIEFVYQLTYVSKIQIVRYINKNKYYQDITELIEQSLDDSKLLINYKITDLDLYLDTLSIQLTSINNETITLYELQKKLTHSGNSNIKFQLYANLIANSIYLSILHSQTQINTFNNKTKHINIIQLNYKYKINGLIFKDAGDYILVPLDKIEHSNQINVQVVIQAILYDSYYERTIQLDNLCTINHVIDRNQQNPLFLQDNNIQIQFVGQTLHQDSQIKYYYVDQQEIQAILDYHTGNIYDALTQQYLYQKIYNQYIGTYKQDDKMKVILHPCSFSNASEQLTISQQLHHCMLVQLSVENNNILVFSPFLVEHENNLELINNQIKILNIKDDNTFMLNFELSQSIGEFSLTLINDKTEQLLIIKNKYFISYDQICKWLFNMKYNDQLYNKMLAHFNLMCNRNLCQFEAHNFTNSCTFTGKIPTQLALNNATQLQAPIIQNNVILNTYQKIQSLYDSYSLSSLDFNLIYNSSETRAQLLDKVQGENNVYGQLNMIFSQQFLQNMGINDQYGYFYFLNDQDKYDKAIEEIQLFLTDKHESSILNIVKDTVINLKPYHLDKIIYIFIKQNDILQIYKLQNKIQAIVNGLVQKIDLQLNIKNRQCFFKALIYLQNVENCQQNVICKLFKNDLSSWVELESNLADPILFESNQYKLIVCFPDISISKVYTLEFIILNELPEISEVEFQEESQSHNCVTIAHELQQRTYMLYLQTNIFTKCLLEKGTLQESLELKVPEQLFTYQIMLEVQENEIKHIFLLSDAKQQIQSRNTNKYYVKINNKIHLVVIDQQKQQVSIYLFEEMIAQYNINYLSVQMHNANQMMLQYPFKQTITIEVDNNNTVYQILADINGVTVDNEVNDQISMRYLCSYKLNNDKLTIDIDERFNVHKEEFIHAGLQKVQRGSNKIIDLNNEYQLSVFDIGSYFIYNVHCSMTYTLVNLFQHKICKAIETDVYSIADYVNQTIITKNHEVKFIFDQEQYKISIKEIDSQSMIDISDLFRTHIFKYNYELILQYESDKEIRIISLDQQQLQMLYLLFQQILPGLQYY